MAPLASFRGDSIAGVSMGRRAAQWLSARTTEYLLLGCPDPADPECRRHNALLNVTALIGRAFALVFVGINLTRGNTALALALLGIFVVASIAMWVQHRTKKHILPAWMSLSISTARGNVLAPRSFTWPPGMAVMNPPTALSMAEEESVRSHGESPKRRSVP